LAQDRLCIAESFQTGEDQGEIPKIPNAKAARGKVMRSIKAKIEQRVPLFFIDYRWWDLIMLLLIFFLGLAARLTDLNDLPLDFHPTRQFHSMVIARGMYYENLENVPDWQRKIAISQWQSEGQIEPQIMERLTAIGYRLVGDDDLRIPRILSIFFWTVGAVGLYLLLRALGVSKGAVIGMAYCFLLPYNICASRSFQPEPLMVAAIIWSWWGLIKWMKKRSWKNALLAGVFAGFAIFVKLPAIFFVAPALITVFLVDQKIKKVISDPQIWSIAILAILPALIYHIDGFYISGFLKGQTSLRFFPNLWVDPYTFLKWKDNIDKTLIFEMFLIGIFGVLLIEQKKFRMMFISIIFGYFLYGLFFSYHIMSHNYYQIPLTPLVAVGLSIANDVLVKKLKGKKFFSLLILGGLISFWLVSNYYTVTQNLSSSDYSGEMTLYQSLGEELQEYNIVSITPNYGYRLDYWGWKESKNWFSKADLILRGLAGTNIDVKTEFSKAIEGSDLFLVTDFTEFDRQPEIQKTLYENYSIFEEGEGYIIFDLRK
jgi:hypothetical protein